MRGYVGVTDYDWYRHLLRSKREEANFWTPSGRQTVRLTPGDTFFFKLKAPHDAIAGFARYVGFESMPAWLAWECFSEGNGCASLDELSLRLQHYRLKNRMEGEADKIGCMILTEVVIFEERDWLPVPPDWAKNTVSGKSYDLIEGHGADLLHLCLAQNAANRGLIPVERPTYAGPRFGAESLVRPRLGQGAFKVLVSQAYEGACAVTREHSLPVLEAAHIQPYAQGGPHDLQNGLLLRSDIHRLFDRGYVSVSPDYRFHVSRRLREEWSNGKHYYEMEGCELHLPNDVEKRPARELLEWHHTQVFRDQAQRG